METAQTKHDKELTRLAAKLSTAQEAGDMGRVAAITAAIEYRKAQAPREKGANRG